MEPYKVRYRDPRGNNISLITQEELLNIVKHTSSAITNAINIDSDLLEEIVYTNGYTLMFVSDLSQKMISRLIFRGRSNSLVKFYKGEISKKNYLRMLRRHRFLFLEIPKNKI